MGSSPISPMPRYATGSMPGSFGFTGQREDTATGLDYYVARYYDAVAGQFTSANATYRGTATTRRASRATPTSRVIWQRRPTQPDTAPGALSVGSWAESLEQPSSMAHRLLAMCRMEAR